MSPVDAYQLALQRQELQADPAQAAFVGQLQDLYRRILNAHEECSEPGFLAGIRALMGRASPREPVRGIYVWGGVGRGKTLLVDFFFDALPIERKMRIHFHAFMQRVHEELRSLGHRRDPLTQVAERLAQETGVLCFDEFHVSDIADAMLLGRLLRALFERGIALIATSNIAPEELYLDGLQREQFLPAIELILRYTKVVHLDSATDYRLRTLERAEVYHHPLDEANRHAMVSCFNELSPEGHERGGSIRIMGRSIPTRGRAGGLVWFDFQDLCASPRSVSDYLELARSHHTVMVSEIPCMDDEHNDAALRFIHLVDTFYDRNVNLVVSAEGAPANLYSGRRLAERFSRTRSRLEEMRSHDYLARAHLP